MTKSGLTFRKVKSGSTFRVMAKRCDQCLFSNKRLVSLRRRDSILWECRATGAHFICHKVTIAGQQDVCCRAFYDTRYDAKHYASGASNKMRIAERLGAVEFVEEKALV